MTNDTRGNIHLSQIKVSLVLKERRPFRVSYHQDSSNECAQASQGRCGIEVGSCGRGGGCRRRATTRSRRVRGGVSFASDAGVYTLDYSVGVCRVELIANLRVGAGGLNVRSTTHIVESRESNTVRVLVSA